MSNYQDFLDKSEAIKLRTDLVMVDQRNQPGISAKPTLTAAEMVGIGGGRSAHSGMSLPVLSDDKRVFAGSLLSSPKKSFTIPGDVTEGTIVQFKNSKETKFGIVTKPPSAIATKAAYVKNISHEEVKKMKTEKKDIKIVDAKIEDKREEDSLEHRKNNIKNILLILGFLLIWTGMIVYFRFFNRI